MPSIKVRLPAVCVVVGVAEAVAAAAAVTDGAALLIFAVDGTNTDVSAAATAGGGFADVAADA